MYGMYCNRQYNFFKFLGQPCGPTHSIFFLCSVRLCSVSSLNEKHLLTYYYKNFDVHSLVRAHRMEINLTERKRLVKVPTINLRLTIKIAIKIKIIDHFTISPGLNIFLQKFLEEFVVECLCTSKPPLLLLLFPELSEFPGKSLAVMVAYFLKV